MYLVQYEKILKKQNKKCCTCFYSAKEALNFSKKIADCPNIKYVELSGIDFVKIKVLYKREKIF